jgi:predicted ATPase
MKMVTGDLCYWEGKLGSAKQYLSEALIPWDATTAKSLAERSGLDAHSIGLAYIAHNEFALGYPDRSRGALAEALQDVDKLGHAQSIGHCLGLAGWLAVFRRDLEAARQLAKRTIDYCHEQRLIFWEASAYLVDGWVLIQDGKVREGVERMHQGFAIRRAAGAALVHANFQAILAECHGKAGKCDAGLALIDEALVHVQRSGERLAEPELYRVRGELVLSKASDLGACAECFERAIAVARGQNAKLYELRATSSLAKLWRQSGKRKEAYDLLAPIYNGFTEGFDTRDLQEAKALLAEVKREG